MGQGRVVVAELDGARRRYRHHGPNRPGRGGHIATGSFMVAPTTAGRGIGRALGEHVVAWAREQDFRGIQFNAVVETNEPAVRLWRSLGFVAIGTVPAPSGTRSTATSGCTSCLDLTELSPNATGFSVSVSNEQLELLDADVIVAFPIFIPTTEITEDPVFPTVPAVKEGRSVVIDGDLAAAYSLSTTLALDYAVEQMVPRLEKAVA